MPSIQFTKSAVLGPPHRQAYTSKRSSSTVALFGVRLLTMSIWAVGWTLVHFAHRLEEWTNSDLTFISQLEFQVTTGANGDLYRDGILIGHLDGILRL